MTRAQSLCISAFKTGIPRISIVERHVLAFLLTRPVTLPFRLPTIFGVGTWSLDATWSDFVGTTLLVHKCSWQFHFSEGPTPRTPIFGLPVMSTRPTVRAFAPGRARVESRYRPQLDEGERATWNQLPTQRLPYVSCAPIPLVTPDVYAAIHRPAQGTVVGALTAALAGCCQPNDQSCRNVHFVFQERRSLGWP